MIHPVETAAETLVGRLRQTVGNTSLAADGQILMPGLWSSYDTAQGAISGRYEAGGDGLLRLSLKVERPGRWCTLSFLLGEGPLAEGDVLGVVADLAGSVPAQIGLTLRTVRGKVQHELAFDDALALVPGGSVQTALLMIPPTGVPADAAGRRLLMLKLPQTDIEIALRDLRIFVLPAADAQTPAESVAVQAE